MYVIKYLRHKCKYTKRMPHEVELILAGEQDLPLIATMASEIWHDHYTEIIGKEQIDYMLNKMYDQEHLSRQLKEEGHVFYLIHSQARPIGFIAVSRVSKDSWFLHKFYLQQQLAGKGQGSRAFQELLEILQPEEIKLTVNRMNYKSVNFYFKNGFVIEKPVTFDIGNGFIMDDFMMVWKKK